MRCYPLATLAFTLAVVLGTVAAPAGATTSSLTKTLQAAMASAGNSSGAYAVDLNTGKVLFSDRASTPRLPASNEKLYTTAVALEKFGATATLQTTVYGTGSLASNGTWNGNLYLKGGGDPTFGSASYDQHYYGSGGATMQALVAAVRRAGITAVNGSIIGDESYFDSDRGTPATNNKPNAYVEGQLSALAYNRGFASTSGSAFQTHPVQFTAAAFVTAMEAAHISVPASDHVYAGYTPKTATQLASVSSPPMSTLIKWTNTPSDNFFAEMLMKGIGAKYGAGGTTADGVAVVKSELSSEFDITPTFNDGSGLSYSDRSTPIQIETLLSQMHDNGYFNQSLAVAGETGTLAHEMNHTVAQGKCRGKTGTLSSVSNLSGYCTDAQGDTIAFSFLMNSINPDNAHGIQDRMAEALAGY